jgi:hypothetical protein
VNVEVLGLIYFVCVFLEKLLDFGFRLGSTLIHFLLQIEDDSLLSLNEFLALFETSVKLRLLFFEEVSDYLYCVVLVVLGTEKSILGFFIELDLEICELLLIGLIGSVSLNF